MSVRCQYHLHRPPPIDVICEQIPSKPPQRGLIRPPAAQPKLPYDAELSGGADHQRLRLPVSLVARGGLRSQRVRVPAGNGVPRAPSAGHDPPVAADSRGWGAVAPLPSRLADLRIGNASDPPPVIQRALRTGAKGPAADLLRPPIRGPREASRADSRAAAASAIAAAIATPMHDCLGIGGVAFAGGRQPLPLQGGVRADTGPGGPVPPRRGAVARGWSAPARRGGRG